MLDKIFKQRKPRNLLLIFEILSILLLFTFNNNNIDRYIVILFLGLILIVYISNLVLGKVSSGDNYIFLIVSMLLSLGIITIYRLSPKLGLRQLIWVLAGILVFYLTYFIIRAMRRLEYMTGLYLGLSILFFLLTIILAPSKYGAKNWIEIGPFMFQPSEFGKIALVLYLAAALSSYEAKNNFKGDAKQLWQPALVAGFSMGCMVLQRDLGSALIFFGISITLLYVATSKRKYVFTALGLAAIGSVAGYAMFGHVRERVKIWLDPWKYALGSSYQIVEGMYSIAAGGLFGVGLGQGHFENLPVKESDMIYAIICEEFGIIFAIGLMIIYFLLFYRGIRAAFVTKDSYSQLIAVGFSTMIACQTLVIIGGIFAVIPLTGITLPIISYGGSSVLTIFFALGILQKISEEA